jgi:hypothetical protein
MFIQKSLSFISRIIFSAIFLPIHLIHSIIVLLLLEIAKSSFSTPRDSTCIATFQPTQEIFINSLKTFFSSFSKNQNKASLFSVF